jgi:hypothetical protein
MKYNTAHRNQYAPSFHSLRWILEKTHAVEGQPKRYFNGRLGVNFVDNLARLMTIGYISKDSEGNDCVKIEWENSGNFHTVMVYFDSLINTQGKRMVRAVWTCQSVVKDFEAMEAITPERKTRTRPTKKAA